jgi:hypothetical protein
VVRWSIGRRPMWPHDAVDHSVPVVRVAQRHQNPSLNTPKVKPSAELALLVILKAA